jgi:hypothetical protein
MKTWVEEKGSTAMEASNHGPGAGPSETVCLTRLHALGTSALGWMEQRQTG